MHNKQSDINNDYDCTSNYIPESVTRQSFIGLDENWSGCNHEVTCKMVVGSNDHRADKKRIVEEMLMSYGDNRQQQSPAPFSISIIHSKNYHLQQASSSSFYSPFS